MPYGMAGCGLGSILIKKDTMMMQTFAGTTNGSSYSQTFGITTGTSNCTAGKGEMALEQEVFMESNLVSLRNEAANCIRRIIGL